MKSGVKKNTPKVSVLMSVYNGGSFLREAVESILNQTFDDFEFLIINDASTDDSLKIVESFNDDRVKIISNEENKGLAYSLNVGVLKSAGEYIVRMDADDVSEPSRVWEQVKFMEDNPNISISGSWVKTIGANSSIWKYPVSNEELRCHALFFSPFAHPSVIFRKRDLINHNISYDPCVFHAEDYDLWERVISKGLKVANIPKPLLNYRLHGGQIGKVFKTGQRETRELIQKRFLDRAGLKYSADDFQSHTKISSYMKIDPQKAEDWLCKIFISNQSTEFFRNEFLREILFQIFLCILDSNKISNKNLLWLIWNSKLRRELRIPLFLFSKIVLKNIIRFKR